MKKETVNMKRQWIKFTIVTILYLLFLLWVGSWLGLLVVPFIYDAYISKKIKWQWWKESEGATHFIMSWVDAIVFALVAVYFINQFFFQNYVIPSSSLEKTLLTGDYLFVSKISYGPRIPQTPLTMPLTQHTMPLLGCKSYIEWPQWDYRRVKGLGNVELNDIVVFNYPAGDSICTTMPYQTEYYSLCYQWGTVAWNRQHGLPDQVNLDSQIDSLPKQQQWDIFKDVYAMGRAVVESNPNQYGHIDSRPTDRRENYVKRCVGLPGQTLQIKDRVIYLDGKKNEDAKDVQYTYSIEFQPGASSLTLTYDYDDLLRELYISSEDLAQLSSTGAMPMTKHAVETLLTHKDIIKDIKICEEVTAGSRLYPQNAVTGWTCDNYGPIWIPKKGESVKLTMDNIAMYERPIKVYEGNDLEVKDNKIYINGQQTDSYTFKLDYYWMMGDNRHNSADSRFWGFVPEDHIVGKPIFIWWSSDPDRSGFKGIRWERLFRGV